jgi:hypothetical protein
MRGDVLAIRERAFPRADHRSLYHLDDSDGGLILSQRQMRGE